MHKRMSPHGDADHIGESIDLVNNYKIDKVYLNDFQLTSLEKRLIKIYQTAIQGTITIEIVNQQMKVTPYLDL
ncbi:MAG: hypothetical protein GX641_01345 [Mollicutes bacterium]|nr:hypothetical protein [Mollicutes bacterium]